MNIITGRNAPAMNTGTAKPTGITMRKAVRKKA